MSSFWSGYLLGVSQNVVAAALLGVPAFIHLVRKLDRHHREARPRLIHVKHDGETTC